MTQKNAIKKALQLGKENPEKSYKVYPKVNKNGKINYYVKVNY